jgi:hypothetical protein
MKIPEFNRSGIFPHQANDCANIKVTHGMALKQCNDVVNMNSALIDAFHDLVLVAFKQSYKQIQMETPNSVFCEMFAWSVAKYAANLRMTAKPIALPWP